MRGASSYGPYMDVPCGLSARGEGGEEADEVSQLESLGEPPS